MAEPWLIRFFACNREMQPFSFFFVIRCGAGDLGSGSGSKFNCAARVGSGRVGSDDLGYGPGSGFSFEPVQTSSSGTDEYEAGNEKNHSILITKN